VTGTGTHPSTPGVPGPQATPTSPPSPLLGTPPTSTPPTVSALLAAELHRLTSRRFVRVLAGFLLGALVVTLVIVAVNSHPPTPADIARAQTQADQAGAMAEQERQACLAAQEQARTIDPAADFGCPPAAAVTPDVNDFLVDSRYRFAAQIKPDVQNLSIMVTLGTFLIGASFIGADWQAGTLAGLLLVEPRRRRVVAVKALVLALGVAAFTVVFFALAIGGYATIAATRGILTGTTDGVVLSALLTAARGVGLAAGAALGGFALAGIFRRTSGALGLAIAYVVLGESLLRSSWDQAPVWLVSTRAAAWLQGGYDVPVAECRTTAEMGYQCGYFGTTVPISTGEAAWYLGALVALALIGFVAVFNRRDVT
jgi:hypothetical protein